MIFERSERNEHIRRRHEATAEDVDQMSAEQGGYAICQETPAEPAPERGPVDALPAA